MVAASAALKAVDLDTTGENIKESVADLIENIDPTETPCLSNFGEDTCGSDQFDWLEDDLATAINNNHHVDGDDFGTTVTGDTTEAPNRMWNAVQISKKQGKIGGRAIAADSYGTSDVKNYHKLKKGMELKRDAEMSITANNAAVFESGATPSETAGIPAWLRTNVTAGSGAPAPANPTLSSTTYGYPNAARTDAGTTQALSEADIRTIIKGVYDNGGKGDVLMMSTANKSNWSAYMIASGKIATPYQDHGKNPRGGIAAVGAVDVYVSDFGILDVIPNRFMRDLDVLVLQKDLWEVVYMKGRKFLSEDLSKIGDSERFHIINDFGLKCRAESGNGIVADVDSTTPMTA